MNNVILPLFVDRMKLAICIELRGWVVELGKLADKKYSDSMVDFLKFVNLYTKRLSKPINDLNDVTNAMASLSELRDEETRLDMEVAPIEVRWII